jgi:8-oxo-dGTP pyrophosphatase MutT (NUDIX family)
METCMSGETTGVRHEHSAGGAVLLVRDGVAMVAMIATRGRRRWGLPKGAIGKHETSERAALREVLEETGLKARILHPLESIEYMFRAGDTLIRKTVDFYLMQYEGGRIRPQLTEVDDAEWVPLDQAVGRASFASEKKLLETVRGTWNALSEEEKKDFVR